ncbi:four helix bundle protein [Marinilabilia rubra]|uniref:Four helix bundle protein n=1 Tax=Marinilabilia rubra TaxID=2162893 RepID=A0A2U2BDT8_9BACT|nr:four helix bundle protein [Marinilabilia rubra]PWE01236.1 four helix bundle protein [Marinilabilia rubra]
MKSYRDLIVWQKAIDLVCLTYKLSKKFPSEEIYSLTSQIKRSSISIPSNIAEGYGRNSKNDYIRFLQIASGSLYEFQTQLEIANRLHYCTNEEFEKIDTLSHEIEKMLSSLIWKLRKN